MVRTSPLIGSFDVSSLIRFGGIVTVYFDTSAMLITFILLGKYLEIVAKGKTSDAIGQLISLRVTLPLLTKYLY